METIEVNVSDPQWQQIIKIIKSGKEHKENKKPRFMNALRRFVYLPDGSFSMTRPIMVLIAISSIALIWVGVVVFVKSGKVLPDNIYTYTIGLMSTSVIQYGATKFFNGKKKKGDDQIEQFIETS